MTIRETIQYTLWWLYITVRDIVHIIIDYLMHRDELLQNANSEHVSFKVVLAEVCNTRDGEQYTFTPATSYSNVDALQQYMIRQTFDSKNNAFDQLIKRKVNIKDSNESVVQRWFNDSVKTINIANRDGLLIDKNGNVSTVPRLDPSVQNAECLRTESETTAYEHSFDEEVSNGKPNETFDENVQNSNE